MNREGWHHTHWDFPLSALVPGPDYPRSAVTLNREDREHMEHLVSDVVEAKRGREETMSWKGVRRLPAKDRLLLTVVEAGELLGMGRSAAYQAIERGEIPVLRFGRKIMIPRLALEKMCLEAQVSAPKKAEKERTEP